MFRTVIASLAVLAPVSALAHDDGHASMSMGAELLHIVTDPIHVAIVAAAVWVGVLLWNAFKIADVKADSKS